MSDNLEPSGESALTIGDDIHALAEALTTCIDAVAILGDTALTPPMLQSLSNHWNILADVLRRYDPERRLS